MEAAEALDRLGGVASAQELLRWSSRRQVRRALGRGGIVRAVRGQYALPTATQGRQAAAALAGIVCLRSAAAHHGWQLKTQPVQPEVAVNPRRRLSPERRDGVRIAWMNVADDDVVAGVTTPLKTVLDCARHLPFDEALTIADSALRSGLVTRADMEATQVRGAGAAAVRRVVARADGRSANAFESVLRALSIEAGLEVVPQEPVELPTGTVHPDLVCRTGRLVLEADSWSFHATRRAHRRDCVRYNLLTAHGWRVFRFTWEQVMHEQTYVRWVLTLITSESVGQEKVPTSAQLSA